MQHLEVSGAVRHIYIYVIRRLKVNIILPSTSGSPQWSALYLYKPKISFIIPRLRCNIISVPGDNVAIHTISSIRLVVPVLQLQTIYS